jgi:tetratricopeptide (TPR) repeat protein
LAVEKNVKYADAYYMLACCHTKKTHFPDAMDFATKAIKYSPIASSRAHFLKYNLYRVMSVRNKKVTFLRQKEFLLSLITLPFDRKATKSVAKVLSYLQFFPMLVKGWIMVARNGVNEAIDLYRNALEKAPGFILLYCLLGDIYRSIGRYEDAVLEYKMAIIMDSLNIPAYRSLCSLYEELGDMDNAIESYQRLIEIQPNAAEYHSNLANILYLKGEPQAAISYYQNAITLNPKPEWTSVIAQTLGYVLQESERNLDAAINAYQSAYLLTPTDLDIYINLGSAFYDKQEYNNALTVYRRALELDPTNAKIHCNLGFLHWGKGDIDEAIKEYELSIKYDSSYDIGYNILGVIYLDDLGRIQTAIQLFEKAIHYNPNYALAHYNLGRSVAIKGDKVEAAKLYQVAMDLNNVTNEIDPQEIVDKIQGLFD